MRCHQCSKRLSLVEKQLTCKCGKNFCTSHRYSNAHDCVFDYKKLQKEKLIKENPPVITPKINRF